MKAADVIGKRIVHVYQYGIKTNVGYQWAVSGFELEDGTVIHLAALETEHLPIVSARLDKGKA